MTRSVLAFALFTLSAAPFASADTYDIDKSHSKATFRLQHFGVSWFWGQFHDLSGTVSFDEKNVGASTLSLTIAADSLFTADKKRDEHLKAPDFFNTKQFPTITFTSTKVTGKGKALQITGDLTLHGVKKSITADAEFVAAGKDPFGGFRAGWEAKIVIKRSDFGMNFMVGGIGDEVTLYISLEGVKK